MRTFALAAVAAIANGRVHEFFAENNFICEMCKTHVNHSARGNESAKKADYAKLPMLETKFIAAN